MPPFPPSILIRPTARHVGNEKKQRNKKQETKSKQRNRETTVGKGMLRTLIARAVGNLPPSYYARQFRSGFVASLVAGCAAGWVGLSFHAAAWLVPLLFVNTLLYPYARIGYECSLGYIIGFRRVRSSQSWMGEHVAARMAGDGETILSVGADRLLGAAIVALCWSGAVVVGPMSLIYLTIFNASHRAAGCGG